MPPCGGHPAMPAFSTSTRTFQVVPPCGGHRVDVSGSAISARVSSRAPVWGASRRHAGQGRGQQFQVVPPCGGHPVELSIKPHSIRFQVVPPCGGHQFLLIRPVCSSMFQVVPPCGGHPARWSRRFCGIGFQVVPPCGGHRIANLGKLICQVVSSRAPVWGASHNNHL